MSTQLSTGTFRRSSRYSLWINRHRKLVLLGPAVVFVAAMVAIPIIFTLYMGMTNSTGSIRAPFDFVGFSNYLTALTDNARFWPAVWRTLVFTAGALSLEVVLGVGIALLLWRPFRGQRWVRITILMPMVATPVAIGMMWLLILEPTIGFVNYALSGFGIIPGPGWISSSSEALVTLIFIDAWQWTPMITLIVLAGLNSLPEEADEAARVDGATGLQRLWYVTIPLVSPVIVVATLLRSIDALKTFDILYATKGKGGGSHHEVETLNIYAYALNFEYNEYGPAAAVIVLFTLLIVACCIAFIFLLRRRRIYS